MNVYELKDVSYTYENGASAMRDVSFNVAPGECLTVIGTNGSGKSTLLEALAALKRPTSGDVLFYGKSLSNGSLPPDFRRRVSILFQNSEAQLFSLTVLDDLMFGPLQMGLGATEAEERARSLMQMLQIEGLAGRGPWDLSGGEMKKVALGTCLSTNPDVLLLDEPTSGLDPRSQVEITDLIMELREAGKTVITATHDLHIIEDISERTVVLGETHGVLLEGRPWEVLNNEEALLRANLIHTHKHRHHWYEHEHSHHGTHGHDHIDTKEDHPKEVITKMEDIEKLKKLIEHWEEHNAEHAETYRQWVEKAREMGRDDIADLLGEIAEKTKGIEDLFKKTKDNF